MATQQIVRPATISDLGPPSAIGSKGGKQRGNNFVLWGFIIMFIGAALGIVGKMLVHEDIITVVGVLTSLVGMFLVGYPYLSPSRREEGDSSSSSQPEVLTPRQPAKYLPQGSTIEYVPSVTERTTDLLKNSAAKRREQKEDADLET
jgi:hypothetical protein